MLSYRLKNYLLASTFLFTAASVYGQKTKDREPAQKDVNFLAKGGPLIEVNLPAFPESAYTPTQLVSDVLISTGSNCGTPQVTNVSVSPNDPVTDNNRFWGYFQKGTSNFPFQAGIVLNTGYARTAGNTAQTGIMSDDNGGGSDADLIAATGTTNAINNAGVLEFDFVPTSTQMKFNYIFASEEYSGSFSCTYDDAFALLLKPNTPGAVYTNLAVLPAGAGPVAVTNIHPANTLCGAVNQQYFGGLANNGTNYTGRTAPLTAQATVIPGQSYHIKMVIADARDSSYGSAVFLEAGSFDIGIQILDPAGVALPPSINMCDNTPQTLTSSFQQAGATYQWTLNGTPISGATSPTYVATQPGVYCLKVFVPGNQCPGEACVTIIGGNSAATQPVTLTQCYGPNDVNFNLTLSQPAMSSTPGVTYTYHLTAADAASGTAPITNFTSFPSAGNQTVYAAVTSGFCTKVEELHLVKAPEMLVSIAQPAGLTCVIPQITLLATGSTYPTGSTFNWVASNGGYIVSGADTLTPVVNTGGTYTLTITKTYQPGDTFCTAVGSVDVLEDKTKPLAGISADVEEICAGESVTLTASGGVSYIWVNTTNTGNVSVLSPTVTTTYQVYAIGANGCQSLEPAEITIEVVPAIVTNLREVSGRICLGDEITLDAGAGPNYTYLWDNGETTQTIIVDEPGTYSVEISNGKCSESFTTQVHLSPLPTVNNVNYENNTITISATNPANGILEFSIDGGVTWQDSNVFAGITNNIVYTIHVRTKGTSCQSNTDFFTFFMSNLITPNGDGSNDSLDFTGISNYNNFSANVTDRYGKSVWKASKQNPVWDGRFQGRLLPTASYWYSVTYEDPASKKVIQKSGWILLKNRE